MADTWTKVRQTVDTSVSDREYVASFIRSVEQLANMTLEMFVTNPAMILSPTMRELMVEKTKLVESRRIKLSGRLVADNPCSNFED